MTTGGTSGGSGSGVWGTSAGSGSTLGSGSGPGVSDGSAAEPKVNNIAAVCKYFFTSDLPGFEVMVWGVSISVWFQRPVPTDSLTVGVMAFSKLSRSSAKRLASVGVSPSRGRLISAQTSLNKVLALPPNTGREKCSNGTHDVSGDVVSMTIGLPPTLMVP